MHKRGLIRRMGIALMALLLATVGVISSGGVLPVNAQDDDVVAQDEAVDAAAITPGTNAVVSNGRSISGPPRHQGTVLQVFSTGTIVAVISARRRQWL